MNSCNKLLALLFLLIVIGAILLLKYESFATGKEKAAAIAKWMEENEDPTYAGFRENIKNVNYVEYEFTRNMKDKSEEAIYNTLYK